MLTRIGQRQNETADERMQRLTNIYSTIFSCLGLGFASLLYYLGHTPQVTVLYLSWAVYQAFLLLLLGIHRLTISSVARAQFVGLPIWSGALLVVLGGFTYVSGQTLWVILAPLGALVMFGSREALYWLYGFIIMLVISVFLPATSAGAAVPTGLRQFMLGWNVVGPTAFVFAILIYFVQQRDMAFRLLRAEQDKAEALLLNILPAEIAAILKNENRIIADNFDAASILFADVVGFTPLSADMKPDELVAILDEVFSHLDGLAETYGLEKIKTIGDCYMAAAGVPNARPDHAQAITRLALDLRDYVNNHDVRGCKLAFRIGINSGPVVAGVIGRKKFIYDLWGDAVNTASRMESHGRANLIQITQATHDLIKDDFECKSLGTIQVKGKGEMPVWSVEGIKNGHAGLG
ncbi:MAG: adenylate/guanylate cyclase domain-containing protein [Caldilineales bacterium]|nr:adenylate/guanylate cyclase domain-containing protein [Caldilineales bacterium]